jgi:hypothetical protein
VHRFAHLAKLKQGSLSGSLASFACEFRQVRGESPRGEKTSVPVKHAYLTVAARVRQETTILEDFPWENRRPQSASGVRLLFLMSDQGRSRTWLWVVIGGGAFFLFVLAVFTLIYLTVRSGQDTSALSGFGDKIGVVDLEGVILNPKTVVGQLKKFADDDSIKAIVLHVNSPGGGVAASEEIIGK